MSQFRALTAKARCTRAMSTTMWPTCQTSRGLQVAHSRRPQRDEELGFEPQELFDAEMALLEQSRIEQQQQR